MRRAAVALVAGLAVACGSPQPAAAVRSAAPSASMAQPTSPSPAGSASPAASPAASPLASPSPPAASPSPLAPPTVTCRTGAAPSAMAMFDSWPADAVIYDVSDPLHPSVVCTIQNTTAHLFTGDTFVYLKNVNPTETDVILHSIGSGNESLAARLPRVGTVFGSWLPDGSVMAYDVRLPETDQYPGGAMEVWVFAQQKLRLLYTYGVGIGDCICRFGLPPLVLSISPDGQYIVSGWLSGKGSEPLAVYRVADGVRLLTASADVFGAMWDRSGHRLFLTGNWAESWAPETGLTPLTASRWTFGPGLSPDASLVGYTAYADQTEAQPRVYVFDLKTGSKRELVDALRSQVVFAKDGWVWYLEEVPCAANCAGSTQPSGRMYAMNLATGVEQPLAFPAGQAPLDRLGDLGWYGFRSPEFWPDA